MNSFLIFFFSLFLTSEAVRNVSFSCLNGGIVKIKYTINPVDDEVTDIFSTDPENNCSLSNNDFIGNGSKDSPYEITVVVNKDLENYKPCGSKIINGRFKVEFATKTFEDFFGKYDRVDSSNCSVDMVKDKDIQIGSFSIDHVRGHPKIGSMKMKLVTANSADIPDGKLILGQKVKLRIEIPKESDALSGRVTLCYIKDTLNHTLDDTFYTTKCPFQSFPVPVRFVTDKINPKIIESTEFKAFRLSEKGGVKFNCFVEVCTKESDPYCSHANDCVPLGTFMHAYKEVETLISSFDESANDSTNQLASIMLMLLMVFIIFITKTN